MRLELSSSLNDFSEVSKLLGHATKIKKCKAVCTVCGEDASYTLRKEEFSNSSLIQVGGEDMYEARCLKHHSDINI